MEAEERGTGVQHICRLPYGGTRKPSWLSPSSQWRTIDRSLPHRKQERLPLRLPRRNSCRGNSHCHHREFIFQRGDSNFVLFADPPPHLLNLKQLRFAFLLFPATYCQMISSRASFDPREYIENVWQINSSRLNEYVDLCSVC